MTEDELQSVPTVKISLKKRTPTGDAAKSNKHSKKHHQPQQQQLKQETPEKTDAAKGTKKRKANEVDRETHLQVDSSPEGGHWTELRCSPVACGAACDSEKAAPG